AVDQDGSCHNTDREGDENVCIRKPALRPVGEEQAEACKEIVAACHCVSSQRLNGQLARSYISSGTSGMATNSGSGPSRPASDDRAVRLADGADFWVERPVISQRCAARW